MITYTIISGNLQLIQLCSRIGKQRKATVKIINTQQEADIFAGKIGVKYLIPALYVEDSYQRTKKLIENFEEIVKFLREEQYKINI